MCSSDLIKSTVKWAGLEPKNDISDTGASGGVRISINLGGQELGSARLVDAAPIIEHGEEAFSDGV